LRFEDVFMLLFSRLESLNNVLSKYIVCLKEAFVWSFGYQILVAHLLCCDLLAGGFRVLGMSLSLMQSRIDLSKKFVGSFCFDSQAKWFLVHLRNIWKCPFLRS